MTLFLSRKETLLPDPCCAHPPLRVLHGIAACAVLEEQEDLVVRDIAGRGRIGLGL